jgi:hypothetical protein
MWMARLSEEFASKSLRRQYEWLACWRKHFALSTRRRSGVTQLLPLNFEERCREHFALIASQLAKCKPKVIVFGDETAALWNPAAVMTVAPRGAKSVAVRVENEKKMSTVLLWATAKIYWQPDGTYKMKVQHGKPLVIFKGCAGSTAKNSIQADADRLSTTHVKCVVSDNGWMTEQLFLNWINDVFHAAGADDPPLTTWLVVDLFAAHRTPRVLQRLKALGVWPKFIPAGCTSKVQIHDVTINRSFKRAMEECFAKLEDAKVRVDREAIARMANVSLM